jgi:hypothetical protein
MRLREWGAGILVALWLLATPHSAAAWGDEGHKVIALIAQAYLEPDVRKTVNAILAADTETLTAHDIASEATWADKLRERNKAGARERTRQWHFVDIEIDAPDLDYACFGHPQLSVGVPASRGPADDCVVDKIEEFAAELRNPSTKPEERLVALKFLLHLVGDLHQPLHASDAHDRGGNEKRVSAAGSKAGNLHRYWDTVFVSQLGPDAKTIASELLIHISPSQAQIWMQGAVSGWAMESFQVAKQDAYGLLPQPSKRHSYRLTADYLAMARQDVAIQLSRAGVRLALILNRSLSNHHPD